jgi:hypothetical protein
MVGMKGASRKRRQETQAAGAADDAAPIPGAFLNVIERLVVGGAYPRMESDFVRALLAHFKSEGRKVDVRISPRGFHVVLQSPDDEIFIDKGVFQTAIRALSGIGESNKPGYTVDLPPPEADETSRLRMRDDFNIALNTAVKLARTEALARLVDLDNPALSDAERLTRSQRLVRSYQRRRAENPNFEPSREVLTAFSIINKAGYPALKAKRAAKRAAKKTKLAM